MKDSPKLEQLKANYPNINVIVIILAIFMLCLGICGLLDSYFFPGSPTFNSLGRNSPDVYCVRYAVSGKVIEVSKEEWGIGEEADEKK